ncbi:hemophore-related protein [Mycobacterium scrofulaceum]|uniref:Hemophore-related protein n=1 Tax=Mycobacterium scrofulaceum TaxID=1783 RepID=A0A1X0K9N3_MYCSC|nr:heme-binding protein [Mycobacterium scrofulaceum]ORB71860.1 hemophore-related protein [Mycobacterium scrofulaceum]
MAAGAAAVAVLFTGAGPAGADGGTDAPEPAPAPSSAPNCTAADLARVSAGVAAATSAYLFTHPDVNAYFTSLRGQPRADARDQLKQYMDANPQTHADLEGIRQPLTDFHNRCQ